MRISVILNPGSGTLQDAEMGSLESILKEALSRGGHEIASWHASAQQVTEVLQQALQCNPDCLMIGGGDGSVSAAARVAWSHHKVLAILPGGTMNLYSRTLGLPLEISECAAAYAQTRVVDVDVATVNEQLFLHQFTVGLHARAIRLRNSMTYGSRLSKILASIRAFARVVIEPPRIKLEMTVGENNPETRTVSALSITNNILGSGHIPYADDPDGGVLGVYYSDPIKLGAAMRLVVDAIRGATETNPDLHCTDAQEVSLRFLRKYKRYTSMIDGELIGIENPMHFRIYPRALQVLLPVVAELEPS